MNLKDYTKLHTSWCNKCPLHITYQTVEKYLQTNPTTVISGIGCTGRVTSFIKNKKQNIHTLHGRAMAVATGIAKFEKVIVYSGDGDLLDIGLSHTIHARARNENIRAICMMNGVYALTGRQFREEKSDILNLISTDTINVFDKDAEKKIKKFLLGEGFGLLVIRFPCFKINKEKEGIKKCKK